MKNKKKERIYKKIIEKGQKYHQNKKNIKERIYKKSAKSKISSTTSVLLMYDKRTYQDQCQWCKTDWIETSGR